MKSKTGLLFLMADVDPAISGYFKLMNPNRYELFTSRYLNDISRHHKISMFSTRVLMSSITWRFLLINLYERKATSQPFSID